MRDQKDRVKPLALGALTSLIALSVSGPLLAQGVDVTEERQSPITGSFEFKLGAYYPSRIDDQFTNQGRQGAFERFYGKDNLFYGELVVERYLFSRFGKFGLGGHIGRARVKGDVQVAEGAMTDEQEGEEGALREVPGETSFRIIPLRASLFYKYDYSAMHHNLPLVPFVRGGLDYYLWRNVDGDGELSQNAEGVVSRGGVSGWHASFGVQLLLDFLDPATAAAFDLSWGINNSYLFGEYLLTRVDGFGRSQFDPTRPNESVKINLSDEQWLFGLAFEF